MKQDSSLNKAYFAAGRDWYIEKYESIKVNANRWFVAFLVSMLLCISLIIALSVMMPLKTLVPMVIHQNTTTGEVWVDRPKTDYTPANDAQVQSDIVRYITARESYSSADLNQRFHHVMLLSAGAIGKEYANEQSNNNKSSPVNLLGSEGVRTVHIEDIVFIDKANTQELRHFRQAAHNLAKIDFTTTILDKSGNKKVDAWVATIAWIYQGLPDSQEEAWDNWNGFTVTTYRVNQRNLAEAKNE